MILRIDIDRTSRVGLRDQVHAEISQVILDGILPPGSKLPSVRLLAGQLDVSVNTVLGSYARLLEDQLIESRHRSGYFVHTDLRVAPPNGSDVVSEINLSVDLEKHLNAAVPPSRYQSIKRPENWRECPYPLVCGQIDVAHFPLTEWRECTRLAMNRHDLSIWTGDNFYRDSEELLDQIRKRILPLRGIFTFSENILVTMGSQQSLYIIASLLGGAEKIVALEDPGYPEARNIFERLFGNVRVIEVDDDGLVVDERLVGVDLVYVTANRQFPTTASMSAARRNLLLKMANDHDFLIIEDDYDGELNYRKDINLALQRQDKSGRVIYIGSMSKSLAPGLRIGFLVADPRLIIEARALRGLMIRHAPMILQNTAALFLRFGHYDALLSRLHASLERRWVLAHEILKQDFRDFQISSSLGGTNFMMTDPNRTRAAKDIAARALLDGVVIEEISSCYHDPDEGIYSFRFGISCVDDAALKQGLSKLRHTINEG
jgi:GntR family transcriptional regulator/MocR family aminotransferase